jgi:hypothetical protein
VIDQQFARRLADDFPPVRNYKNTLAALSSALDDSCRDDRLTAAGRENVEDVLVAGERSLDVLNVLRLKCVEVAIRVTPS